MDPTTDPLVALAAWLITWALGYLLRELNLRPKVTRKFLPLVAGVAAVALRAGIDVVTVDGLTWSTLGQGIVAGCVAVAGHSQGRELLKLLLERASASEEVPASEEAPASETVH